MARKGRGDLLRARLRAAVKSSGLTPWEAAQRCGIGRSTFYAWLSEGASGYAPPARSVEFVELKLKEGS